MDRYVAVLFLSSYATALLLVVGLFWIIEMAGDLEDFLEPGPGGARVPTTLVLHYYMLQLPYLFLQVAPFVTLVAGVFTVNRLLRGNEVVAVLSAGVSAHRMLMPIAAGGLLATAGMFVVREWIAVHVADERDSLRYQLENREADRVYRYLQLRDLRGSLLRFGEYYPDRQTANDFEAILRGPDGETVYYAESALWKDGRWVLQGGRRYEIGDTQTKVEVGVFDEPGFTPELAMVYRRARENPLELSFAEVETLIRRDPDDVVYRTLWQYHLTFPLANIVLLLIGVPVMLGYERGRGTERTAMGGLLVLVYFSTDFVCRSLGLGGTLSPLVAAWLPVLLFGSLGVVLYDSMRT